MKLQLKKCFKATALMLLVILSVGLASAFFFLSVVPVYRIQKLQDHFIQVKVIDKRPVYTWTNKKPVQWVSLKSLNKKAVHAIVISEDWAFYEHQGIDLNQTKKALLEFLFEGEPLRGASTISQQLAKNLFLENEKTLWRKFRELLITVYLEKTLSKQKILETYLNVIEYGPGIYGLSSASRYYFSLPASQLRAKEGAFLAMLLPSPVKYSSSFRKKQLSHYAEQTINSILNKLVVARYMGADEALFEKRRPFGWQLPEDFLSF